MHSIVKSNLVTPAEDFYKVPFEIKIGLLKFICDDLKINVYDFIETQRIDLINTLERGQDKITSICPKEFINSLYE